MVIDSSVALASLFSDESNSYADSALDRCRDCAAVVPSLCLLEVANALIVAERRGRIDEPGSIRGLALLRDLPLQVETDLSDASVDRILTLSRRHSLSAYDAAYLELAQRLGLPLATLDDRLKSAAREEGVETFHP